MPTTPKSAVEAFRAEARPYSRASPSAPDAVAAVDQMTNEARQIEQQWSLRREHARYEAERARRQYDAVEPENRLVARSLERAWEDRLREQRRLEEEYARS